MDWRRIHAGISALVALVFLRNLVNVLTYFLPIGIDYQPGLLTIGGWLAISSLSMLGFGWLAIGLWFARPDREIALAIALGLVGQSVSVALGVVSLVESLRYVGFLLPYLLGDLVITAIYVGILVSSIAFIPDSRLYARTLAKSPPLFDGPRAALGDVFDSVAAMRGDRTPRSIPGHALLWIGESVGILVLLGVVGLLGLALHESILRSVFWATDDAIWRRQALLIFLLFGIGVVAQVWLFFRRITFLVTDRDLVG